MAEKSRAYYEEELRGIEPCTEDEMKQLVPALMCQDRKARDRFIEGNLHRVFDAAAFFTTKNISFMDLVQEGHDDVDNDMVPLLGDIRPRHEGGDDEEKADQLLHPGRGDMEEISKQDL